MADKKEEDISLLDPKKGPILVENVNGPDTIGKVPEHKISAKEKVNTKKELKKLGLFED